MIYLINPKTKQVTMSWTEDSVNFKNGAVRTKRRICVTSYHWMTNPDFLSNFIYQFRKQRNDGDTFKIIR